MASGIPLYYLTLTGAPEEQSDSRWEMMLGRSRGEQHRECRRVGPRAPSLPGSPHQAAFVALRNDIRGIMEGKAPSALANEPARGADYIPLEMVETRHET